ncbi:MAG: TonB-dependent receptor [Bacteroidota bacterium]
MVSPLRYRWILSLVLAATGSDFSASQDLTIYGSIVDSVTLEPIPHANIRIVGESMGTAANARGFFSLSGIPPGPHTVLTTAVGYLPSRKEVTGAGTRSLDIRLVATTVELGEVVITGKRTAHIPLPVTGLRRLEQSQLRAVPVPVQKDVIRSLLTLPGIVSTSDVNSRFYVRGGAGDQNLILLNGMRLYSPFHALGMYSIFDPDVIRSVDVYTGAFPAGFGGRLSSVVSLETIDPRADRTSAGAEVNLLSSRVQINTPISPSSRMFVHARHSMFPDTFRRLSGFDRTFSFYDVLAKVNTDILGPNSVSALLCLSGDDLRSQESTGASYRWRNQLIGLSSHGLIANRAYLMASIYVSRYSAERVPDPYSIVTPTSTGVVQPGIRVDATLYMPRPNDFLNFGMEFVVPETSYDFVSGTGLKRNYEEESPSELSGWIRSHSEFGGTQVEAGIHLQFVNIQRMGWWGVEPRLNVSQNLWSDWNARLAFGRISQSMVTANNEDDLIPVFDAWIGLPKGLKPEFADHYIAALDGSIGDGLSLGFQVYRKQYKNLVLYNREKIVRTDPDFLSGGGKSSGFESTIRFSLEPVDLSCAYTFSRTEVSSQGLNYPPRYDIRHVINVLAQFRVSASFDITALWGFKSGAPFTQTVGYYSRLLLSNPALDPFHDDPGSLYAILGLKNAARLPSYHRLDISARYRFALHSLSAELGGSLVNVYNRKNIFYFERKTGRRYNMLPFFPSMYVSVSI